MAEAIDRFCRTHEIMDVSGRAQRGVLTGADIAAWSATIEEPIGYDYGRYRVLKPGP
jgi:gamma-glutamyltranspeptidase/glutathione hydrolase